MKNLVFVIQFSIPGTLHYSKGKTFQEAMTQLAKTPKKGESIRLDIFETESEKDIDLSDPHKMFEIMNADFHIHSETVTL